MILVWSRSITPCGIERTLTADCNRRKFRELYRTARNTQSDGRLTRWPFRSTTQLSPTTSRFLVQSAVSLTRASHISARRASIRPRSSRRDLRPTCCRSVSRSYPSYIIRAVRWRRRRTECLPRHRVAGVSSAVVTGSRLKSETFRRISAAPHELRHCYAAEELTNADRLASALPQVSQRSGSNLHSNWMCSCKITAFPRGISSSESSVSQSPTNLHH